jgi:enoyl-CoA hydratase
MDYQNIIVQKQANKVVLITLNRPQALNALSPELTLELSNVSRTT